MFFNRSDLSSTKLLIYTYQHMNKLEDVGIPDFYKINIQIKMHNFLTFVFYFAFQLWFVNKYKQTYIGLWPETKKYVDLWSIWNLHAKLNLWFGPIIHIYIYLFLILINGRNLSGVLTIYVKSKNKKLQKLCNSVSLDFCFRHKTFKVNNNDYCYLIYRKTNDNYIWVCNYYNKIIGNITILYHLFHSTDIWENQMGFDNIRNVAQFHTQ